jgi:molybdenum cofactor biosynthesis enzyme MoaA
LSLVVLASALHHAVHRPAQVNVVVMAGVNDDEVPDFVELTRHEPINVRFIEYMPFDGNVWRDSKMVPFRAMVDAIHARCVRGGAGAHCSGVGFRVTPSGAPQRP